MEYIGLFIITAMRISNPQINLYKPGNLSGATQNAPDISAVSWRLSAYVMEMIYINTGLKLLW
jgi:hypothetical protein